MTKVYICGVPSSGNRLLKELLRDPNVLVPQIKHWGEGGLRGEVEGDLRNGLDPRVVLLTRDTDCLKQSLSKHYVNWAKGTHERWKSLDQVIATHWQNTMRVVAETGVPVTVVTYEQLVADPEAVIRRLTGWLGLPYKGLRQEVRDENAKWRGHAHV